MLPKSVSWTLRGQYKVPDFKSTKSLVNNHLIQKPNELNLSEFWNAKLQWHLPKHLRQITTWQKRKKSWSPKVCMFYISVILTLGIITRSIHILGPEQKRAIIIAPSKSKSTRFKSASLLFPIAGKMFS